MRGSVRKTKHSLNNSCVLLSKINWLNLREENEGVNIILKQANKGIGKDKFSSFEYGLWYIKQYEDSRRKRHKARIADMMFIN